MTIKTMTRGALQTTRLYTPLLEVRNRILRPQWWVRERGFDTLIGPMVRNELVFDVGANHGSYSARLLRSRPGRIIACEPQPGLSQALRQRFAARPEVRIVDKAVGAAPGVIPMNISEDGDQVSSCRPDWKQVFPEQHWGKTVDVPVTTLDALIAEFGMPGFCKVDVEGFEPEVLAGLTRRIPAMSLEFTPKVPHITHAVLKRLGELGYRRINYALHEVFNFVLPNDVTPAEAESVLIDNLPANHRGGGDIYAFAD
jgi:FkbM family methyltransferase